MNTTYLTMILNLQKMFDIQLIEPERLTNLLKYTNTLQQFVGVAQQTLLASRAFDKSQYLKDIQGPSNNPGSEEREEEPIKGKSNNIEDMALEEQIYQTTQEGEVDYEENPRLKELYYNALKSKDHKRHFQVIYIFKNKIKRMYRIDCMTRKINV
jgi:hypothetical protein